MTLTADGQSFRAKRCAAAFSGLCPAVTSPDCVNFCASAVLRTNDTRLTILMPYLVGAMPVGPSPQNWLCGPQSIIVTQHWSIYMDLRDCKPKVNSIFFNCDCLFCIVTVNVSFFVGEKSF